jgi:hypothetical protein
MINSEHKYGKSPVNPIRMSSVNESILFLNSLVTIDNKPILYHRVHTTSTLKSKPIDCYEVFKVGGSKEIFFVDVHASETSDEVPEGYLKNTEIIIPTLYKGCIICKTIGVNFKLSNFPDDLI